MDDIATLHVFRGDADRKPKRMVRPQHIVWQHERTDDWTARADGVIVGRVQHHGLYELHTNDDQVQGSHTTLGNAQAQLGAWYSWVAAHQT